MPALNLVLGSASPARLATLRGAGVTPAVVVSNVDEDAVLAAARERFGKLAPEDAVLVLAQAKAESVAAFVANREADNHHSDLVVGCDSMLEIDGEVLGRPADVAEAVARWQQMRGRSGTLHTGHWLIDLRESDAGGTGATIGATSSTICHFSNLDDDEVASYVATGEPLRVAGAFTVDGLGGPYVERIEGDFHGVVGISLPLLRALLDEIGVPWRDLRSIPTDTA